MALNDVASCNAFIGHLKTFYTALGPTIIPTGQIYTIGSTCVTMDTPATIIGVTPQSVTGSAGSGPAPPQVAMIASWKTAHAGRSYRGRNYIGPISIGVLATTGLFTGAATTTLQTAMNTLLNNVNTSMPSASNMVVWSKKLNDGDFILSGVARGRTGTMRTRN